jgi:kynurenine formamidase
MKLRLDDNSYIETTKGIDVSIPLRAGVENVNAWYVNPVSIEPVRTEQFTGSVAEGGAVNFRNITFNPHGNGTHTECVGHISTEDISINQLLKEFHFLAELITINPEKIGEDLVITLSQVKKATNDFKGKALLIRTLPNESTKLNFQYSNTNPPYLEKGVMNYLNSIGVDHFLIDLPSVDKELDNGELQEHHSFWNYPSEDVFLHKTITEMIYVPEQVEDGTYFLNLQIASFENDASPSKPILYEIQTD